MGVGDKGGSGGIVGGGDNGRNDGAVGGGDNGGSGGILGGGDNGGNGGTVGVAGKGGKDGTVDGGRGEGLGVWASAVTIRAAANSAMTPVTLISISEDLEYRSIASRAVIGCRRR